MTPTPCLSFHFFIFVFGLKEKTTLRTRDTLFCLVAGTQQTKGEARALLNRDTHTFFSYSFYLLQTSARSNREKKKISGHI